MNLSVIFQNIGHNICYLRRSHGLTRKEMAAVLEISTNTLRRIERGDQTVRMNCWKLRLLCDHFDLSADAVLHTRLDDNGEDKL